MSTSPSLELMRDIFKNMQFIRQLNDIVYHVKKKKKTYKHLICFFNFFFFFFAFSVLCCVCVCVRLDFMFFEGNQ